MFNPMKWWSALQVALVFAAGITSFVWAIAVYRTGLRVALVANQLALASVCLANNGTFDDALCTSYLAAFNTNLAALSTAIGRGDGTASIVLFPTDAAAHHHSLSLTLILVITFVCTAAGVFVLSQLSGLLHRRAETGVAAHELDEMKLEEDEETTKTTTNRTRRRDGNGKVPGLVGVRPLRP